MILITGVAGFIGSNLAIKLIKDGYVVVGIDNLYSGYLSNLNSIINHNNFTFINCDIIKNIPDIKPSIIYHLACPASPKIYQKNPINTLDVNYIGTKNILELAKKYNSKVIFSSTSEVYGNPLEHPQRETYIGSLDPKCIRSCYDIGKKISETLCWEYKRNYNLDIKIVRLFNTYGPNMNINDGRVLTNFIKQCLTNENITIYGDGKQTRSFCYIDDTINALLIVMNSHIDGPINIGNPEEYNIIDVAKKIKQITNSNSEIKYVDLPEGDPVRRKPCIKQLLKLNYKPLVPFDNGIKKLLNYLKSNIKNVSDFE